MDVDAYGAWRMESMPRLASRLATSSNKANTGGP